MKLKTIQIISLRVIILFTIAMLSTFLGEYLHSFFGDWYCNGSGKGIFYPADDNNFSRTIYNGCQYTDGYHLKTWHWGYRHWLYLVMCIILFIIQAIDIINFIDKNKK